MSERLPTAPPNSPALTSTDYDFESVTSEMNSIAEQVEHREGLRDHGQAVLSSRLELPHVHTASLDHDIEISSTDGGSSIQGAPSPSSNGATRSTPTSVLSVVDVLEYPSKAEKAMKMLEAVAYVVDTILKQLTTLNSSYQTSLF